MINNQSGSLFDVTSDADLRYNDFSQLTFNNAGTFRKSAGAGVTDVINIVFNNTGAVELQTGQVRVIGGGTSSGSTSLAAGTRLIVDNGYTFTAASSVTGTGSGAVTLSGGTVNVQGTYNVPGGVTLNGATANFSGTIVNVVWRWAFQPVRPTSRRPSARPSPA